MVQHEKAQTIYYAAVTESNKVHMRRVCSPALPRKRVHACADDMFSALSVLRIDRKRLNKCQEG